MITPFRDAVDAALKSRPLTDREFRALQRGPWQDDYERAQDNSERRTVVRGAVAETRRWRGAYEPGRHRGVQPVADFAAKGRLDARADALSRLVASSAAQLAVLVDGVPAVRPVANYRDAYLSEGPLSLDGLYGWINEQSRRRPELGAAVLSEARDPHEPPDHLMLAIPSGDAMRDLGLITAWLSAATRWSRIEAAAFVFCDVCPRIDPVRSRVLQAADDVPPAASRIVLDVDFAMEPRDVGAAYRDLRNRYLTKQRYREIGERAVQLAAFATTRPREPLRVQMEAWNRLVRTKRWPAEWAAKLVQNYGRDRDAELRRVRGDGVIRLLQVEHYEPEGES